jgi:hypothetical protein
MDITEIESLGNVTKNYTTTSWKLYKKSITFWTHNLLNLSYKDIKFQQAWCQWLTPVIPATQEAELRSGSKPAQANSS